jgi:phosphoribosylamine--glycine ligase
VIGVRLSNHQKDAPPIIAEAAGGFYPTAGGFCRTAGGVGNREANQMKILVVGSGGREHALVWKIAQSSLSGEILAAPGNAGIEELARTVDVAADDPDGLVRLASEEGVDLTVVGPELPLTAGLADRLAENGLAVFGPTSAGARLEGSKWFAKELMLRAGVPTARAFLAESSDEAMSHVRETGFPVVIKADGLAAGKGVVIARTAEEAELAIDDALVRGRFGESGRRVLVEEHLEGEEASILAFTDGERSALMVPSQDHKRAFDGDEGPNTGGMGAYAPAPVVVPEMLPAIKRDIVDATVAAMREADGTIYRGVLYAGLMITDEGPKVIEFNCRFGDPEAQVTLPLLDADIVEVMAATARGELDPSAVRATGGAAACVVMASGGYPGSYEKGRTIGGLDAASGLDGVAVFHAGTAKRGDEVVTSGGRVLGVTGFASDLESALARAYEGARTITFAGAHFRTDIGHRALARM